MQRSRFTLLGVNLALLWLLASSALLPQTTSGGVNGTVRDPANAVVPGASITLLEIDKNTTRRVESDASGLYSFPNIPPGRYQLAVEKSGFRRWTGSLVLQVQQVAVVDAMLAGRRSRFDRGSEGGYPGHRRGELQPRDRDRVGAHPGACRSTGGVTQTLFQVTPGVEQLLLPARERNEPGCGGNPAGRRFDHRSLSRRAAPHLSRPSTRFRSSPSISTPPPSSRIRPPSRW